MKRKKHRMNMGHAMAFLRAQGLPGGRKGVSAYDLVASALVAAGRFRSPGQSARDFCCSQSHFLATFANTKKKKKPAKRRERKYVPTPTHADVASREFLQTYEWRRVRMMALKRYGARCMCCGASPETGATMNVDHIKPRKLFPQLALDLDNLQILCHECNHGKGNWDMTDWRPEEYDEDPVPKWIYEIAKEDPL